MKRPNTWYKTSRQPIIHEATPPPIYTEPAKTKQNPPQCKSKAGWKQHIR